MGGIAYRYQISLSALMAANPQINPNQMPIGTILVIPSAGNSHNPPRPAFTPLPVSLGPVHCVLVQDGGTWCFLMVHNPSEQAVVEVSVAVRIPGAGNDPAREEIIPTMLDRLPKHSSLPVAAYFAGPLPTSLQASAAIQSALPLSVDQNRFLTAQLKDQQTDISTNGLWASISGKIMLDLPADPNKMVLVRIAGAAFDEAGNLVGVRLWEKKSALPGEEGITYKFTLYSAAGRITRLKTWVEAVPVQ